MHTLKIQFDYQFLFQTVSGSFCGLSMSYLLVLFVTIENDATFSIYMCSLLGDESISSSIASKSTCRVLRPHSIFSFSGGCECRSIETGSRSGRRIKRDLQRYFVQRMHRQ